MNIKMDTWTNQSFQNLLTMSNHFKAKAAMKENYIKPNPTEDLNVGSVKCVFILNK